MALHLSTQDREKIEADLDAAEPYSDEEMRTLDKELEFSRVKATMARKFLRMADEEDHKDEKS